jgi:hypothetical protein
MRRVRGELARDLENIPDGVVRPGQVERLKRRAQPEHFEEGAGGLEGLRELGQRKGAAREQHEVADEAGVAPVRLPARVEEAAEAAERGGDRRDRAREGERRELGRREDVREDLGEAVREGLRARADGELEAVRAAREERARAADGDLCELRPGDANPRGLRAARLRPEDQLPLRQDGDEVPREARAAADLDALRVDRRELELLRALSRPHDRLRLPHQPSAVCERR